MGNDMRVDYRPRSNGHGIQVTHKPLPPKFVEPEGEWETGHVKFYDTKRAFGFVRSDEGYDVLLHWRCLRNSGVNDRDVIDDMPVRFKSKAVPGRSREATIVRLA